MAHVTHDNRMFFDHFLFHFFSVDVSIGGIGFVIEFFCDVRLWGNNGLEVESRVDRY